MLGVRFSMLRRPLFSILLIAGYMHGPATYMVHKIPSPTFLFRFVFDLDLGLKLRLVNMKNKPYDEVLGAAQFTERTSISCQKLSKVVKSCQKLSKVVKSCQNVVKRCQKLSKVVKSC